MDSAIQNYIVIVSISGVLHLLLVIYALSVKTQFTGIRTFVWMCIFSSVYAFGFAFELASESIAEAKLWIAVEYLGMPYIAPCSLMLAFHYVNLERHLTRRVQAALFAIPVITSVMVASNDLHGLFYQAIFPRTDTERLMIDVVIGRWYIVHGSFTFACLLAGGVVLIRHWRRTYRLQMATVLVSLYVPMLGALVYLLDLTPQGMDPVPIIMSLTSTLYIFAILSTGMLRVSPIARERVFENMRDAVLVLDRDGRIGDFNRSAARLLPGLGEGAIGKPVSILVVPDIEQSIPDADDPAALEPQEHKLQRMLSDELRHYQVRVSPLLNRHRQLIGRTIIFIDVTEQTTLHDKLQRMATTDGLTELYNRSHFVELASRKLDAAIATDAPYTVILLDIDRFKQINDGHGHDVGDAALRHVATVCRSLLRSGDLFARYGGEEFVLAVADIPPEGAALLAERLRAAIETTPLPLAEGMLSMTASFGVCSRVDEQELAQLIAQADQALYSAKRSGRNRVARFDKAASADEDALDIG